MRGGDDMACALRDELDSLRRKAKKRLKRARRGDVDGVHDARTTLRRARVLLDVARLLEHGGRAIDRADDRLRDVERALGDLRDDDVLLADVASAERHDPRLREARRRVEASRAKHARATKGDLDALTRRRALRAMKRAARALRSPRAGDPTKAAPRLLRHHADAAVWRAYGRLLAYEAIPRGSPEAIHHVRAACRELRYVIELLGPALPPAAARTARDLAEVQVRLGAMHDDHVAVERLARWIRRGDLAASAALVGYVSARRASREAIRGAFERTWRALSSASFRRALAYAITGERVPPRAIAPLEAAVH